MLIFLKISQEAYVRAKSILYKRSKEHKRLADALLKYETLDASEVKLAIQGLPIPSKWKYEDWSHLQMLIYKQRALAAKYIKRQQKNENRSKLSQENSV